MHHCKAVNTPIKMLKKKNGFPANYTRGRGPMYTLAMATCREHETKRRQVAGA